jgi:hypothetical protein
MSDSERTFAIKKRIQQLITDFYKKVNVDQTETELHAYKMHRIQIDFVFNYWKLKRRTNKIATSPYDVHSQLMPVTNKALMFPRSSDLTIRTHSERMLNARIRTFIHLRQDMEKVRMLCHMVYKREKLKRQFFETNQQLFEKQVDFIRKYTLTNSTSTSTTSDTATSSSFDSSPSLPLRSGRLRDILQIKSDQCIYDFPHLWNVNQIDSQPFDSETKPTVLETSFNNNNKNFKVLTKTAIKEDDNEVTISTSDGENKENTTSPSLPSSSNSKLNINQFVVFYFVFFPLLLFLLIILNFFFVFISIANCCWLKRIN